MISPALARLMLHLRNMVMRNMDAPAGRGLHHVLLVFSADDQSPMLVGVSSDLGTFDEIEAAVLDRLAALRVEHDHTKAKAASDPGSGGPGQSN